jgi:hypothetical protein
MSRYMSFIVQSWRDDREPGMRWKVHSIRGDQELCFPDASFVIRTWIEDEEQVVRCLIRHVQSGREVQFQSGMRAIEFVRTWLGSDLAMSIECDLQATLTPEIVEDEPPGRAEADS